MTEPAPPRTLSVVVPVYWNEGSIPRLGDEMAVFEQRLAALGMRLELICVDDGSGEVRILG
jgi:dolichol-phosphate mannosyltransferase